MVQDFLSSKLPYLNNFWPIEVSILFFNADFERFATEMLYIFPGVPQEKGLWENISLCSDVVEGAWYLLYDDKKKPTKS